MIVNNISAASTSLSASLSRVSLKDDIEGIRAWFFWSLIGSTVIVLIGVFIEGIEHLVSEESSKSAWNKSIERIGWILVVMGVLGEGVFEGLTPIADNILQDFNGTLLALTTDQARSAAHSATIARSEADAIKKDTAQLRSDLGNEITDAKTAEAGLKQGQSVLNDLQNQLRTEFDLDNLILLANASKIDFKPTVFRSLRDFKPAKTVNVRVYASDVSAPPVQRFARMLQRAFSDVPGWESPQMVRPWEHTPETMTGITLFNKWVTRSDGAFSEGPPTPTLEADWSFSQWHLERLGVPKGHQQRLAILAVALGAKLEKDPNLDEWTFQLVVSNPK